MDVGVRATQDEYMTYSGENAGADFPNKAELTNVNETRRKCDDAVFVKR